MSEDDDIRAVAGEYVLGTLPAAERAAFEERMARDRAARHEVRTWEARLSPLDAIVRPARPSAVVWDLIERAIDGEEGRAPESNVIALADRRARRWRAVALASMAAAAGLAVAFVVERWPFGAAPPGRYIAVVDDSGAAPAFIVRVDLAGGTVRVQAVAAEAPADRDLQLWFIAGEGSAPRSLGLLPASGAAELPAAVVRLAEDGPGLFAVSVEPKGGAPETPGVPATGPTGPVVYSGRLIAEE